MAENSLELCLPEVVILCIAVQGAHSEPGKGGPSVCAQPCSTVRMTTASCVPGTALVYSLSLLLEVANDLPF